MGRKRDEGEKSGLKDEDRALWQQVTRDAKPLAKRELPPARPKTPEAPPAKTEPAKVEPGAKRESKPARPLPRARPATSVRRAEPALEHGRAAGVDRRRSERLRRGQLPVEARLDLHGYTQDQAHAALGDFLGESQARSLRCVLVITGKGTTTDSGGVLRAQVPRWLNEPGNRARVLAFDYAQPKHGGLGAIYVLLRRKKSG